MRISDTLSKPRESITPSLLISRGVEVIELDWRPPAGGDADMLKLLEKQGS